MADKDNMSIDEILAACRSADGAGTGDASPPAAASAESAPAASQPATSEPATSEPTTAAGGTAKPAGQMSIEEIMAAARGEKAGAPQPAAVAADASAAAGKPAKPAGQMSIEEIMAAARGEKAQSAAAKPAAATGGKAKTAPPASKASPKAPAPTPTGPRDTSSILAAARKPAKPGPMSKSEAAAKQAAKPAAKKSAPPMPEKPAYAQPKPPVKADPEDRRSFMAVIFGSFMAVGFTSLALVHALWGLGLARFMFPNILIEPPSKFKVGFPGDFAPDAVATKFKAQYGIWVVNCEYEGQRMITALKSVCTHLGCTPNWLEGEQKFKCPCHGSGFYKDGINFEGPAPRPLERYAIRVADDGQIEVDKSKKFQQEMGQWNSSTSYIPV